MAQRLEDIVWPGWEVIDKLGEGSFGGVYEIQRTLPDGTVERAALKKLTVPRDPGEIKELYAQRYDSASITAHFHEQMQELVREYTFMQKLGENPNVVHCQDLRTIQHDDGIGWDIYIRMELLKPLKVWLDDRYNERRVIRLGLNLCSALNGCHQRNIIHRDIKPENILVTDEGRFKLGDFGIAKVSEKTATGTLTGTYGYMAPEIANRQHYGGSADIYSLGLVMYWMMNERTLPFLPLKQIPSGVQRQEAQDRRFSGEEIPAPVNGTPELTRIVLKACAFDPQERYHSVRELAEDLNRHYQNLRNGAVRAPGSGKWQQTEKTPARGQENSVTGTGGTYVPHRTQKLPKKKRNPWKPFLIAGIALLVIGVMGLGISISVLTQRGRPKSAAPEATPPPETEPVKIHVMAAAEDLASVDWDKRAGQPFWGQTEYLRSDVKTVTFRGTLDGVPDNAWDVSEGKDRSILAWMESGNLFVAADGKISPNPNASWMFAYFENANAIDFGNCFDTSMVTDMGWMFSYCISLTELNVSGFDTSRVTNMDWMFSDCSSLIELDVSGFDTSSATDMSKMFSACISLTELNVSGFDTSRVTNMDFMFSGCISLRELDVSGFDTSKVTDMAAMFQDCSSLIELDVSGFDTSRVTNMDFMFGGCISLRELDVSGFDTSKVTGMAAMFEGCDSLTGLDVSGFDTSRVTNMDWMFHGCSSLIELDVSGFDTSSATDMSEMFSYCISLTELNVSGFDTSMVTNMSFMFSQCSSLTELDVSGFDTSMVTNMSFMFSQCSSLTELDVSGFDTSMVTDMSSMFYSCSSLTGLDVSGFDTSMVTYMYGMFSGCSSLTELDASGFDTSKVTDMERMFSGCSSLNSIQCTDSRILAEFENR